MPILCRHDWVLLNKYNLFYSKNLSFWSDSCFQLKKNVILIQNNCNFYSLLGVNQAQNKFSK